MGVSINGVSINGEGTRLWGVIRVDKDRSSDTSLQMWLANDEEHLKEQILEEWLQDYNDEGDSFRKQVEKDFETDWEYRIISYEIDMTGLMRPWIQL
jgi:hypothetical protein